MELEGRRTVLKLLNISVTFTVKIKKICFIRLEREYPLFGLVSVSFFTTVPNGLQLRWLSGRSH
jgi:hypothetical protein